MVQTYNAKVVIISSWQMNGTEARRKALKHQIEGLCIYNIDFINPNFEGNLGDIKLPSRLLGMPLHQSGTKGKCVFCGKEATTDIYWGVAY